MVNKRGNKMDMKKRDFRSELLERAIDALPMEEWTEETKEELERKSDEEPFRLALELIDYLNRQLEF